jgi:methionyl-tRNA formyltransferase
MKVTEGKIRIIIASPHQRHNHLEMSLRNNSALEVLRIFDPTHLEIAKLLKFSPRYIFFPHWSWVIPKEIYEKFECVIFHMTDLPYGRGGSPLQNLIIRGHKETKICAIRCVKILDGGPIYMKMPLSLLGSAEEILQNAANITEIIIKKIILEQISPVDQTGEPIEFQRRTSKDGNIGDLMQLEKVYDFIRMLDADGYPSAFIETEHLKFEFTRAIFNKNSVEANVKITMRKS